MRSMTILITNIYNSLKTENRKINSNQLFLVAEPRLSQQLSGYKPDELKDFLMIWGKMITFPINQSCFKKLNREKNNICFKVFKRILFNLFLS